MKRDGHYELHLTISKEVSFDNAHPSSILAVDMGERNIATVVLFANSFTSNQSKPIFMGRNVRGLRRKYAYLRKKLGKKKLLRMVRKVSNREQRKVNDILHKISRQIVDVAKENMLSYYWATYLESEIEQEADDSTGSLQACHSIGRQSTSRIRQTGKEHQC